MISGLPNVATQGWSACLKGCNLMEKERVVWLKFVLHSVRQRVVRLAEGAVQGPAARAGKGPRAWACRAHQDLLCPPHQGCTIALQGNWSPQ